MIRFRSAFSKKRLEENQTTPITDDLVSRCLKVSTNHGLLNKVKAFSARLFPKNSAEPAESSFTTTTSDPEDTESWGDSERTFPRFEELPIELKLAIFELYLEKPRITTLNFVSSDLLEYSHMFERSFHLTCGSLPPILCLNHQYRNTFLERFTQPGPARLSQTTLHLDDDEDHVILYDSFDKVSPIKSALTVFEAPHTRRLISYNPIDTIWIQGDFWLDELRRSALARSAFHNLYHLAIQYKTRRKSIFEVEDMLSFVQCIITTFPNLRTLTLVLDSEGVVSERPIYDGEIIFKSPERVKIVVDVPVNSPPTIRQNLSRLWKEARGIPVLSSPRIQSDVEHWSAVRLGHDAWRILDFIKQRAIDAGSNGLPVSPWSVASDVHRWHVPDISVVTASLSTSPNNRTREPTIRLEEW